MPLVRVGGGKSRNGHPRIEKVNTGYSSSFGSLSLGVRRVEFISEPPIPSRPTLPFVTRLDFRFANEGGSFLHNLRTVVLDPQRRIHRQFDGNKWKATELAEAMGEAAQVRQ